jgi:uncharacterized protein YxeA
MKKGVILLITIFFITTLSVLIMKHLKDSEEFIEEVSLEQSLTQIRVTSENIKEEIKKVVDEHSDNIDEIVEITSSGIPFDYGNVNAFITLDYFDSEDALCNINDINFSNVTEECEDVVRHISYEYDFIELRNKYSKINNQDRLDYFVKKYQQRTRDDRLDKVLDQLTYISSSNNEEDSKKLKCSYTISVNNNMANGYFIFKSNSKLSEDEALFLY